MLERGEGKRRGRGERVEEGKDEKEEREERRQQQRRETERERENLRNQWPCGVEEDSGEGGEREGRGGEHGVRGESVWEREITSTKYGRGESNPHTGNPASQVVVLWSPARERPSAAPAHRLRAVVEVVPVVAGAHPVVVGGGVVGLQ